VEVEKNESKISDGEAKLLKDLMSKKATLKDLEKTVAELKGKLDSYGDIDPQKAVEYKQTVEQERIKKLEEKGEWEALKKQMQDEQSKVVSQLNQEIERLKHELDNGKGEVSKLKMKTVFDEQKQFFRDKTTLTSAKAQVIYGNHFELKDDGSVVAYDKPVGNPAKMPLVDSLGNYLSFDQAMMKIISLDPERDELLRSEIKTGSNSGTVNIPGSEGILKPKMSSIDKIKDGLLNQNT
jgi:hypothetical protein